MGSFRVTLEKDVSIQAYIIVSAEAADDAVRLAREMDARGEVKYSTLSGTPRGAASLISVVERRSL